MEPWYSECCDAAPDEFFSLNFCFPSMPTGLCDNCKEHTEFYHDGAQEDE